MPKRGQSGPHRRLPMADRLEWRACHHPAEAGLYEVLFGRNELSRFIFDHLRQNPDGVTSREIAEALCAYKGWDASNRDFMTAVVHKASAQLPKFGRAAREFQNCAGISGCGGSHEPAGAGQLNVTLKSRGLSAARSPRFRHALFSLAALTVGHVAHSRYRPTPAVVHQRRPGMTA